MISTLLLCLLLAKADLYFASLSAACKGWSILCFFACCLQRLISTLLFCLLLAKADLYFASLPAACKGWSLLCLFACCLQRLIYALLLCLLLARFWTMILYRHTLLAWLNEPLQVTQTQTLKMLFSMVMPWCLGFAVGDRRIPIQWRLLLLLLLLLRLGRTLCLYIAWRLPVVSQIMEAFGFA